MAFNLNDNYTSAFTINGVQPKSFVFDFNTNNYTDWLNKTSEALQNSDSSLEFAPSDLKLNLRPTGATSADMSDSDMQKAFNSIFGDSNDQLTNAQRNLFWGGMLKTVGSASDFFSKSVGLSSIGTTNIKRDAALQGYDNQMAALDNQLLNLKGQLADRFNKTVETSIMDIAAKNLRVTSGGVLEMNKDLAQEMTEDIQIADSNIRLNKIALNAAKKQTKEAARHEKFATIMSFVQSAAKLGMMISSGGGIGQSWGSLYAGYQSAQALEEAGAAQEFNKIY